MKNEVVLLDIEGTTTAISFVYDVLFPYAAANVAVFLRDHGRDAEVRDACAAIAKDVVADEASLTGDERILAVVRRQMVGDVKTTGLKQLQGLIWRHGYETGGIQGHVYPDLPTRLEAWARDGRRAAIYSSGSKLAQQLLFRHSVAGDLTPRIAAYFDTTIGPKREAGSYVAIATALDVAPSAVLFCTDQPGEAQAAATAGMDALIVMRPGNPPLPAHLAFAVHSDLTRI